MKHLLIIIISILSISFFGQTKAENKSIMDKTKARQTEIIKEEKIKEAIKKYDALIELNSKNDTAYYKRAMAKFNLAIVHMKIQKLGRAPTDIIEDAINDYTEAIKLKSKYTAEAYYGRQQAHAHAGYVTTSDIEDLEKAVEINPKLSAAWYWLAMNSYMGNEKKGINCFTKVIELDSSSPSSLYIHGAYFFRGSCRSVLNDYKGAIEDYTKVIELDNKEHYDSLSEGQVYGKRAYLKDELKDYKGAIEDYTKAMDLQSNTKYYRFTWDLFSRGTCKQNLGDKEGACLDWKKAAEIDDVNFRREINLKDTLSKYCK